MKLKELLRTVDSETYVFISGYEGNLIPWDGYIYELKDWYNGDYQELLNGNVLKINPCGNEELEIVVIIPFNEKSWVQRMNQEFNSSSNLSYHTISNCTYVFNTAFPEEGFGWSRCNEKDTDKQDLAKGIAIAYARYKNYKIPKEL